MIIFNHILMPGRFKLIPFISFAIILFFVCGISDSMAAKKPEPVPKKSELVNSAEVNLPRQQQEKTDISKKSVKMFIDGVQIYGTIAKPQAVFIISATDPKVDGLKINRHFFDDIFRNVEKSSLKRVRKKQEKKNKEMIEW